MRLREVSRGRRDGEGADFNSGTVTGPERSWRRAERGRARSLPPPPPPPQRGGDAGGRGMKAGLGTGAGTEGCWGGGDRAPEDGAVVGV